MADETEADGNAAEKNMKKNSKINVLYRFRTISKKMIKEKEALSRRCSSRIKSVCKKKKNQQWFWKFVIRSARRTFE